jgi:excinuclease UvrABC ATPase subunit
VRDLLTWSTTGAVKAAGDAAPLVTALARILHTMNAVGLGHLALERPVTTLSRGEGQRLKLAGLLGTPLSDVLYILDEPTAGLHPEDRARILPLISGLRDAGNTVLVVEHALDVAAAADYIVETGPVPGRDGGRIVFAGSYKDLEKADTETGKLLKAKPRVAESPRAVRDLIKIRRATAHNLRGFDVEIPRAVLTAITGVSGSGKSSLLVDSWPAEVPRVLIDQSAIAGSRRSTVATWSGAMDHLRDRFAKENGVKASLFSANSDGACPSCGGLGVTYTDLAHLGTVTSTCSHCDGQRYTPDVLHYTWRGVTITSTLAMTVADAMVHVENDTKLGPLLLRLNRVGLGYLALGQPLTTLSGGERQRLRLAGILDERSAVICLDEPTTGLHPLDVDELTDVLSEMVDDGATVVLADHHPRVLERCDWIIALGPGAGPDGGELLSTGPRDDLAKRPTSRSRRSAAH